MNSTSKYPALLGVESFHAGSDFCKLLIIFANSLGPNQNVGPDLDPNCLTLLIVLLKDFFLKVNSEKSQKTTTKA